MAADTVTKDFPFVLPFSLKGRTAAQKLRQLRMISPSGSASDYWLFHGFKCDMVVVVVCTAYTHTHTHFTQFTHATHPWQHFI